MAPDLVEAHRKASPVQRRAAASSACRVAVVASGVADPAVHEALELLAGKIVQPPAGLRARLDALAADLDEQYFALHEGPDPEGRTEALRLFSMARAVAALSFALEPDTALLHEAVYEAAAAVDPPDAVLQAASAELLR